MDNLGAKPLFIVWDLEGFDEAGDLCYKSHKENLVVNPGKIELLKYVSNLTPAASGFIFLGVGACSTAAAVTNTSLSSNAAPGHEYIDDPTRKWARNSSGSFLSSGDITAESTTPDCYTFTEKITYKFVFGAQAAGDGTQSNIIGPIQSYALFSTWVLPGTVDGTSGTMLNQLVEDSAFNKTAVNALNAYVTLWF